MGFLVRNWNTAKGGRGIPGTSKETVFLLCLILSLISKKLFLENGPFQLRTFKDSFLARYVVQGIGARVLGNNVKPENVPIQSAPLGFSRQEVRTSHHLVVSLGTCIAEKQVIPSVPLTRSNRRHAVAESSVLTFPGGILLFQHTLCPSCKHFMDSA